MSFEPHQDRGSNLVGAFLERRYRVDSLIARGGMSTVYRGLDTRLERPVALKVMDSRLSGDRSFIERFEREARSSARLHRPDVVAVYDQGVDRKPEGDHVYLVMQLVEGCTLRDLLRARGQLSLPVTLSVLEPVLSALAAAHEAGLVHRDIKPENVLIGQDGTVKVADFGLVRAAASAGATSGNIILGTVAYLAPEQVTTGAADARSDLYAAGIVLYEMLTGEPPFTGDTALSVAYRHVNDDVPAPSSRAPELACEIDDLVLRATRRDPALRPSGAAAFLTEVQKARTELGIEPVTVVVPPSERDTARMAEVGPPTDEISPVATSGPRSGSGGPEGTRAFPREELDVGPTPTHPTPAGRDQLGDPPRDGRRRRVGRTTAVWTALILVLAGLIGVATWWISTSDVEVPQVTGQPVEAAEKRLRDVQLSPVVTHEHHNTFPEGTVISSSPSLGATVPTGDEVELRVSLGRPRVPTIAEGTSVEEAQSTLRTAKLQPRTDNAVDRYHPTVPEGTVIEVTPGPGTRLAISSPVTLVVSKGPPPVQVPDVHGMTKEEAFAALRSVGFEPYEAGRQFADDVDTNRAISTTPSAGTEVRLTGKPRVGVVVSNAVAVPRFTGMRAREAQQHAASLGLRLNVRTFFNRPSSMIIGQFPLAGSKVAPGTVVHATAF